MKKNGFTLVELLAVIAILAILVIVAMPNVLGMFNEAKANTFVTEVQKYMDTAKTAFVNDALSNPAKSIYYSSEDRNDLNSKKLDMDGSKEYFIEMDRHGNFKRIIIKDDSFCYDIYSSGATINFDNSNSKLMNSIDKSSVNVNDVWNSETTDSIIVSHDGSNFRVKGCEAVTTVNGSASNSNLDSFTYSYCIGWECYDITQNYQIGMTWREWVNSSYNTIGLVPINVGTPVLHWIEGERYPYAVVTTTKCIDTSEDRVSLDDQIIKGENYTSRENGMSLWDDTIYPGDEYFVCSGGNMTYDQERFIKE